MKFTGVTRAIAIACATTLPMSAATRRGQDHLVRRERDQRHDEEAQPLVGDVPALAAEGPEAVPRVVVRDRDEEGAGGREAVVVSRSDEQREHGEVDGVAARADRAELGQLHPVVRRAQGAAGASAARHDGGRGALHLAEPTRSRCGRSRPG